MAMNPKVSEIQVTEIADKPLLDESKESKSGCGGKRPGAGRKPNPTKLLKGVSRETLAHAVANIDIGAVVASLLRSKKK